VADVTARVAATTEKPVLGCFLAAPDLPSHLPIDRAEAPGAGVPAFGSPEPAARALARAARYAHWRTTPPGAMPELDGCDVDAARSVVTRHLAAEPEGGWLSPTDVTEVLAAVGIPVVRDREVGSPEEAAAAATELGFPVALKAAGNEIVHKSDIGGVALDLGSAEEVAAAYRGMVDRIGGAMTGAQVQQMAAPGVETIVGVVQDHLFGPLVLFGMGGTATELLGDRSFRILPVTDADAAELVRSLRSSPLLFGYRGAPPAATGELEELLQRIGRLAAAVPEMAELDVNPVIVSRSHRGRRRACGGSRPRAAPPGSGRAGSRSCSPPGPAG
jgi:acyl-CoA synthetase (NDP forming)